MGISDTPALVAPGALLDAARASWFDGRRLGYSFVLGAVAGIVAAVAQYGPGMIVVTRSRLLGFAAAGYAGADFISGAFQRWLPRG